MKKYILYIFICFSLIAPVFLMRPVYSFTDLGGSSKGVTDYLDSSYGIIVISGISTIYSKILYDAADKQEKESKANVEKVDKMIASFKDSYAAFCPKGRDDMSDPKCYCYGTDGSQNSSRTNSQICIDLWNKNSYLLSGTSTNYNLGAYDPDVAGCVMANGVFDETCKCKKLIDSNGKNACKKETAVSMPNDAFSTGLATSGGAADLLKFAANTNNGNPRFDLLNPATLGAKAVRSRQISDALLSKVEKGVNVPVITAANADKYAKAIIGEKNLQNAMNSSSMATNVSDARSDNPAIANALKRAEAKTGLVMSGGNGLNAKKEKKKPGFEMNFGSDSPGSNGQVLQDFPEDQKNYKYKNSDIVTDNSASIFEIISNRYVQSGLKRLFDDEETK